MGKSLLPAIAVLAFSSATLSAQTLKGRVLTERGARAADVSVKFINRDDGVVTRKDGSFKITFTKLPDTLIFSGTGFEPYTVIITEKNIHDLDFEVVMLNARESLKYEMLERDSVGSAYGFISGVVPGVKISGGYDTDKSSPRLMRLPKSASSGTISAPADPRVVLTDTSIIPKAGILTKSKILTAGEVNDFNKWKMWEDYSESEFKSFNSKWGMKTNRRFSIQLTDKNHNAVMNEAVFLINKNTLDTVWRTYTDNTGKAELWADFVGDSTQKGDYYISDGYRHTVFNPAEFANGVNLLVVEKSCQISNDVDIAFVVDATGSMGDEIEFLKLELEDVIRSTMDKYKSLALRASSVFYRDRGDEYLTRINPFSDDLLKTLNFIKLQRSGGGGDYPEAVDIALGLALDSLRWNKNARARILFLLLDAPAHDEAVKKMQQLAVKAAAMGIRIVPVACSGTDKSTEFMLRSMALATNGTYTFLTNHSGVGNKHIEPTTDKYEVELLNSLLQRIIGQLLYSKECNSEDEQLIKQPKIKQPENILSVKVYPNPTNGKFTIESSKEIKELFIADFSGKILMRLTGRGTKNVWQVDIGQYPSGAYLVKYITADNKWGAEKVILMR